MGIREQAAKDFEANLNSAGDTINLISPENITYLLTALVFRTDIQTEPGTKIQEVLPLSKIKIPLGNLPSVLLDLPGEDLPNVLRNWKVETSDITGELISGYILNPLFDKTLGYMVFNLEATE